MSQVRVDRYLVVSAFANKFLTNVLSKPCRVCFVSYTNIRKVVTALSHNSYDICIYNSNAYLKYTYFIQYI